MLLGGLLSGGRCGTTGSVWAVTNARLLVHHRRLLLMLLHSCHWLLLLRFLSSSIRQLLLIGRQVAGGGRGLSVAVRLVSVPVAVLSHGGSGCVPNNAHQINLTGVKNEHFKLKSGTTQSYRYTLIIYLLLFGVFK